MSTQSRRLDSVCVYCGSSNAARPEYLAAAATLGQRIAEDGVRLVYGGGGVGLMGAAARAAHEAGGRVLGIIPEFLTSHERPLTTVETIIVQSMHQRKMMMFEESDAFAILPGGIGTLEEVIELLSWRRLALHAKPIVFYNPDNFYDGLFDFFQKFIDERLIPPEFADTWRAVTDIEELLPAIKTMPTNAFATPPGMEHVT
jgi:uncharacterized protein (TIGR00730 family)